MGFILPSFRQMRILFFHFNYLLKGTHAKGRHFGLLSSLSCMLPAAEHDSAPAPHPCLNGKLLISTEEKVLRSRIEANARPDFHSRHHIPTERRAFQMINGLIELINLYISAYFSEKQAILGLFGNF